jgi:hypothetical protein
MTAVSQTIIKITISITEKGLITIATLTRTKTTTAGTIWAIIIRTIIITRGATTTRTINKF